MVQPLRRDIVCMGASTGGVLALRQILAQLPGDFPAAVFVVQHQAEVAGSELARILGADCALRVVDALHGDLIERGRVYIAPADNHLMVREGRVEVLRLARENGFRPAVNPLFRSAAEAYRSRVVAVVLTGALDCGTAGLLSVKANGGVAVAQDPDSAACRDMPENAIRAGVVDHIVPLSRMAALLSDLTRQGGIDAEPSPLPPEVKAFAFVTCPSCHGSLQETTRSGVAEFGCHVGHRFSLRSLYAEQADQVEFAMWAAIRALEESAALATRLADTAHGQLHARFLDKQRTMAQHADTLRDMVLAGQQSTRQDSSELPQASKDTDKAVRDLLAVPGNASPGARGPGGTDAGA
ncbi:MAG TPA: chemotaxis protein CheB [Polyangiaceae bacterium]|nr:chemotaxis protein CheB [Polyangiaceae bacterium]